MNKHVYIMGLWFMCLDSTSQLQQHKEVEAQHYPRQYHQPKYLAQQSFPDYDSDDDIVDYGAGDQQTARNVVWDSAARAQTRTADFLPSSSRLIQGAAEQKISVPRHSTMSLVENWPNPQRRMGQLSAVDIDEHGNVLVFHRGDRTWSFDTFSMENIYQHRNKGPISDNTVVVFNSSTGEVVKEWGSGMFYMPHGLTVDFEDNVWVTDVALHQVFKFPPGGSGQPLITLGVPFVPANDRHHFCKPTDVAVMKSNGDFFVSDGYCNSRIIKYSKNGTLLLQWGRSSSALAPPFSPYSFDVPHALALAEEKQLLCVADRENGRVMCYNCHNSTFMFQIQSDVIGSKIYSVAYTPAQGGVLYLVNSPRANAASVFSINITSKQIIEQFPVSGDEVAQPHDIAVSPDGGKVYVVELTGYKVWKFAKDDVNGSILETGKNTSDNGALLTAAASLSQSSPNSVASNFSKSKEASELHHKEATSVAAALGVIIGATAVVGIIVLVVLLKLKRKGEPVIHLSKKRSPEYSKLVVDDDDDDDDGEEDNAEV